MTIQTYEADTLGLRIAVTTPDMTPLDLTAATVVASASQEGQGTIPASTIDIPDPASGTIDVTFNAGTFTGRTGIHTMQCRVQIGAEVQTVVEERINVRSSL